MSGTTNAPTEYSVRFVLPDLLERGRGNLLRCPVYRAANLVAPTSGTVSIYDDSGAAIVSGAAVTISGSVATYAYTPAATLALAEGWRVEWDLVVDGAAFHARNEAALVRTRLRCPVADQDLYAVVSSLDPSSKSPIHAQTSLAEYIESAWQTIERRMIAKGKRPYLVMSPSALYDVALNLSLANTFDDFATRMNPAHGERARVYRERYDAAWRDLRFVYDEADEGRADSTRRVSATPTVWLCGRG